MRKGWVPLGLLMLWMGVPTLAAEEATLRLPPASLTQWYKPANKRQVWLHTMFKLRREMQAVSEYASQRRPELLAKWAQRLADDYRRIAEMVPEWRDELELAQVERLLKAVDQADYTALQRAQRKLKNSCNACHREYQAVTALLYRAPDFTSRSLSSPVGGDPIDYSDAMAALSRQVNRIKIASEDQQPEAALQALSQLQAGLQRLGEGCGECHKGPQPRERILGEETRQTLAALRAAIGSGDQKQTGRQLGTAAVIVCARCHGVHRTGYALGPQLRRALSR